MGVQICSASRDAAFAIPQELNGTASARTWLLPLIRRNTRGASLAFWDSHLLASARACGQCHHRLPTGVMLVGLKSALG